MDGLRKALIPLAALALAGPASARTIAGWEVRPAADSCSMSAVFEDDVTLALIWSPGSGNMAFLAAGEDWDDLRAEGDAKVPLDLRFEGELEYDQWIDDGARVIATSRGAKLGVLGNWGRERVGDLGATIAGASGVSVRVGERELGAFDLSGTREAYRELMRCGRELVPAG